MKRTTANRLPIEITDTLTQRISSRLSPPTNAGCLLWLGSRLPAGYGRISVKIDGQYHNIYTHRYVATATYGPIPDDMVVDHLCHNPPCCEPTHLDITTHTENSVYRSNGKHPALVRLALTHCRNGHEYTDATTGRRANGSRRCLECRREWLQRQNRL
jgi:hypothetical protein